MDESEIRENPYDPPKSSVSPSPAMRRSVGATVMRIGAILVAVGILLFVGLFVSFNFFMENEGPPPFAHQLALLVSLALVPLGLIVFVIGALIWTLRRFRT